VVIPASSNPHSCAFAMISSLLSIYFPLSYYSGNNICQSRHSGESRNPDVVPAKAGNQ
jgi:hypothetical protein